VISIASLLATTEPIRQVRGGIHVPGWDRRSECKLRWRWAHRRKPWKPAL